MARNRSYCIFVVLLVSMSAAVFGQGVKVARPVLDSESGHEQQERDRVQQRREYFNSGRTAKGERAADLLLRAYRQKMKMRQQARQAAAQFFSANGATNAANSLQGSGTPGFANLTWTSLGPRPSISDPTGFQSYGSVVGRVNALAVDQKDITGNTVYAGGAFGGIWKSTNAASADPNAAVWTPLTEDQPTLSIGAIAIQPGSSSNLILAGTGEPNLAGDSYYGLGILRSTDAGQTWTLISSADAATRPFRGLGFSKIAFSSSNPNLVVAATAGTIGANFGAELAGATRGLYYSTDAGLTWFYANVQDPGGTVIPGSATDVVYNPARNLFYAAIRFHGFYSSSNGVNWTRLANQPGTLLTATNCPFGSAASATCPLVRAALGVRPDTSETYVIFVSVDTAGNEVNQGMYKLEAGGTWSKLTTTGIDTCGDTAGCGVEQGPFNLYLQPAPNGSNTDLYFGAVNIFKCTLSAVDPLCASAGWKNLTHVYGCSPIAATSHVHPDQHAIDYSAASPLIVYFGNDGGLYRTINASGLTNGTCLGSNPFGNLNANLGSFSQFVGFSQNAANPGILLGGLQDNGSPVFDSANSGANGSTWSTANTGDGGFNAIDPASPNVFYTSNNDVSVQRCALGTSCTPDAWTTVANTASVGGDTAAFYPPYLLDPGDSGKLLIGTCRVWRGNSAGAGFIALSNNFAVGSATACTGGTGSGSTKVRSLAAGGPVTANGAQVIYAGMVGLVLPAAGKIFVTTSADGGVGTWVDRTGSINPSGYDISGIHVQLSDTTGKTAWVTIMGFGTGHVFKTTDAGVTWVDKSAGLPDAPANSVAVDPDDTNIVYVGTDVGVFVSVDGGATWAELGSGLPNVPAIQLRAINSGSVKKLRVATYGRGMWEIDRPAAGVSASPSALAFKTVVGRISAAQTISLTNSSASAITISSITPTTQFAQTNNCGSSLASGAACAINVVFQPAVAGPVPGSVAVSFSAAGSPVTAALNGMGVDFTLSLVRPARPARNSAIVAGQSIFFDLKLTGTEIVSEGADSLVTFECLSAPRGAVCSVEPATATLSQLTTPVRVVAQTTAGSRRAQRLRNSRPGTGTPPGIYTLQVVAKVGNVSRSVAVSLNVR